VHCRVAVQLSEDGGNVVALPPAKRDCAAIRSAAAAEVKGAERHWPAGHHLVPNHLPPIPRSATSSPPHNIGLDRMVVVALACSRTPEKASSRLPEFPCR
jgi:hypothetical protein